MREENICCEMLRTFADGACEGSDTAVAINKEGVKDMGVAAAPSTEKTAADVLPTNKTAAEVLPTNKKGVKEKDSIIQTSTQAAAAKREKAFEALIRGEYKDLYDARVSETVRRRLGAARESEAKLAALAPTAALLSDLLGTDPNDADAIGNRIKGLLDGEREAAQKKEWDEKQSEERYQTWEREARELATRYEGFDIERELGNGQFRAMLQAGVGMQNAFFAVHAEELLPATLTHAVRAVREQVTRAVQNGSVRVSEEGLTPRASASAKSDVSRLSRAEREAIIRRVAKGERITF